jgi:hypothetical protein
MRIRPRTLGIALVLRGSLSWLYCIFHPMRIRLRTLGNALVSSVAELGSLLWLHCIFHPMRIRHRTLGNALVLRGSALFCGFIVFSIL